MSEPKRLGLISDLHCGSQYALVPPSYRPAGGDKVFPGIHVMDYLWECWDHFCTNCPPLDALIVNGDLIEGESPTMRDTMDAVTDNFLTQGQMAEETLAMIVKKARTWWLVRGTSFHDGKHFETIEAVAKNMGAEQWTPHRYTGYVLEGDWEGLKINATHHQTTGAIYPGTLSSRTALFATAAKELGKTHQADLIVRSHLHFKHIARAYNKWYVATPAWKIANPYAIKRMEYYRANLLSDLGAVVLTSTDDGLAWDDTSFAYPGFKYPERKV